VAGLLTEPLRGHAGTVRDRPERVVVYSLLWPVGSLLWPVGSLLWPVS